VRGFDSGLPIIWGGVHPTIAPDSTLTHPLVDAICIGEGEFTFLEYVAALKARTPLDGIAGLGFKRADGQAVINQRRSDLYDLNTLPSLPYHLLDVPAYFGPTNYFGFDTDKLFSIESSRGCPFRCTYCVQSVYHQPLRRMKDETVIRHIQDGLNAGFRGVCFVDDNFFYSKRKSFQTMQAMATRGWDIEVYVSARADYLNAVDEQTIALMKRIGIKCLCVGAESGSNEVLAQIDKGEKIEEILAANRRMAPTGISTWFCFISGFPMEHLDDIIATYQAMTKIVRENPHARVNNKKLIPNPFTPIYHQCVARGMAEPKTLEDFVDIEDLRWENHACYVDHEVEEFFRNTRYYDLVLKYQSYLRAPNISSKERLLKPFFELAFTITSWLMERRYRNKTYGRAGDTVFFSFFVRLLRPIFIRFRLQ
jgi:anaerobic magnesium-protoporphyrin IX monomethyl ester cyclase